MPDDEVNAEMDAHRAQGGLCGLDGCDNPLPAPVVDDQGRRKGGRPSAYCCKAHADAASRARRNARTDAVADPLVTLHEIAATFSPVAQHLLEHLTAMKNGLDAAEAGAISSVSSAHEETAAARSEAEQAQRAVGQAERARDNALVASRDDRAARDEARKEASRAEEAAQEAKQRAWATVAEHERARGLAEAATDAATKERDSVLADLRDMREQLRNLQASERDAAAELGTAREQLRSVQAAHQLDQERLADLRARLEAVETAAASAGEQARMDLDRVRAQVSQQHADLDRLRSELADERTARTLAQSRSEAAEHSVAECRAQLTDAGSRIDQLLAMAASAPQQPASEAPTPGENDPPQ